MFAASITRRDALKQTAALLAAASAGVHLYPSLGNAADEASAQLGWPQANGPFGNFVPARYGCELVDDLAKARLLWASETKDIGFAKGTASGYVAELVRKPSHPGSCSGPIVADGKVFASSFRPAGGTWAENLPHLKHDKNDKWKKQNPNKLKRNLSIEADDLLVAIDQQTGKTLWKAVEEKKGLNLYMGKREGFGVGPAYHAGRVFSMGTTGRLYAYDADNGKKLWETDIGAAHAQMEEEKKEALADKRLPQNFGWDCSLVVVEGVLIVPLYEHSVDMGLRGVDVANGKTLWELPKVNSRYATPAIFHHEGREYLVVANRQGELRMIDPRDGKVLWTKTGLKPNWGPLATGKKHVLANVGSPQIGTKDTHYGLVGAYEITPKGARQTWVMPDKPDFWFENHMDSCARRRVVIRDGLVYYYSRNKAGGTRNQALSILREETGEVLLTTDEVQGDELIYPIEDRLLHWTDASHSDRAKLQLFTADPNSFKRLCEPWKPPQDTTTAYEVFMETPYVNGCIFLRSSEGDVCCYDLRKA